MDFSETSSKVLVIGSVNMDTLLYIDSFPSANTTVTSKDTIVLPGGKGLNLARCLRSLGTSLQFIAAVGDDSDCLALRGLLGPAEADLLEGFVVKKDHPTGSALILVNSVGENEIVVSPGANRALAFEDVPKSAFSDANILVMCLETSIDLAMKCFEKMKELKGVTVLNVSPSGRIDPILVQLSDFIILNKTELSDLRAQLKVPEGSPIPLRPNQTLVLTKGKEGVEIHTSESQNPYTFPSFKAPSVIDTTGAGDSFLAGFISELIRSKGDVKKAVAFGQKTAAYKIGFKGACIPATSYAYIEGLDFDKGTL